MVLFSEHPIASLLQMRTHRGRCTWCIVATQRLYDHFVLGLHQLDAAQTHTHANLNVLGDLYAVCIDGRK